MKFTSIEIRICNIESYRITELYKKHWDAGYQVIRNLPTYRNIFIIGRSISTIIRGRWRHG